MNQTDRTADVTAFFAAAQWTGVSVEDRPAWLKARREMVTASDVAALLGYDDHRSALDVYADKVCPPQDEVIGLSDPRFWGTVLEQPVLQAVAGYYGWQYRRGGALLRSRKHPLLGATLDAEIDRGEGWLPFEGKTSRIPKDWDEKTETLPARVLIQAQSQLLVTAAPSNVVFALLQGSRPCQVEVEPSPEFHSLIVETAEEFVERVRTLSPPPPMEGKSERQALTRIYPKEDGTFVLLSSEAVEWSREYKEVGKQIKQLEKRRDHIADLLRATLGRATYGVLPEPVEGKRVWRLQTDKRAAYTVAPAEFKKLIALKEMPSE